MPLLQISCFWWVWQSRTWWTDQYKLTHRWIRDLEADTKSTWQYPGSARSNGATAPGFIMLRVCVCQSVWRFSHRITSRWLMPESGYSRLTVNQSLSLPIKKPDWLYNLSSISSCSGLSTGDSGIFLDRGCVARVLLKGISIWLNVARGFLADSFIIICYR